MRVSGHPREALAGVAAAVAASGSGTVVDMYFGFPHPRLLVEGDAITATGHRVPDMSRLEMKAKTVLLGDELCNFYPPWNPLGGDANPKRAEPCPT